MTDSPESTNPPTEGEATADLLGTTTDTPGVEPAAPAPRARRATKKAAKTAKSTAAVPDQGDATAAVGSSDLDSSTAATSDTETDAPAPVKATRAPRATKTAKTARVSKAAKAAAEAAVDVASEAAGAAAPAPETAADLSASPAETAEADPATPAPAKTTRTRKAASAPTKTTRSRKKAVAAPADALLDLAIGGPPDAAPAMTAEPAALTEPVAELIDPEETEALLAEAATEDPAVDETTTDETATDETAETAAPAAAPPAFGLLFQAPQPAPRRASRPAGAATPPTAAERAERERQAAQAAEDLLAHGTEASADTETEPAPTRRGTSGRGSRRGRGANQEPAETPADETDQTVAPTQLECAEAQDADSAQTPETAETRTEDGEGGSTRNRRRRGGRGRRPRTDGETQAAEEDTDGESANESAEPEAEQDDTQGSSTAKRRRRRRRSGSPGENEDPPGTVTKVREPRRERERDEPTSVRGSTRLEAKKMRRREGREAGRRRTVITEKEFLARRESVERVMVVRRREGRTQIGVLEDGILVEHYVSRTTNSSLAGNVYLGRVQNVLPSMEAAFVDIGRGRNAVLYAGEVNWDVAGLETGAAKRIENVLSSGESVLVQVTKDPLGHKGARLTSQISLPGRYLVYVPQGNMTGISRKLPDTERSRLKGILKEIVPSDAGVIVRTAAEGASEEELRRDVERLAAKWEKISAGAAAKTGRKATAGGAPTLLYSEPDLTVRVIRDVFNEDFSSLVVAGDEVWQEISEYVEDVAPDLASRMSKWTGEEDIFTAHRVDEQLVKALDRKVYLPSGGSLVIDRTEAMTVVDVNTGKFVGSGGNLEETVTKNNLEAAEEIVRQLRLRDIGGIIVIDFIDMVLEANRDLVVRRLLECLGRDRTKHQVAEVTSLGLVQMTRKRVASGLLEVFSETCEHCDGRGIIVRADPIDRPVDVGSGAFDNKHGGSGNGSNSHGSNSHSSGNGSNGNGSSGIGSNGGGSNGGGSGNGQGGGRGNSRRGRGAAETPAAEVQPNRGGPTAAQIAAAAHAAALKSAAQLESGSGEGSSTDQGPGDQVERDNTGSSDQTSSADQSADVAGTPTAGPLATEAAATGAGSTETSVTDASTEAPPATGRSRRRRGRATAPAGPPKTSV